MNGSPLAPGNERNDQTTLAFWDMPYKSPPGAERIPKNTKSLRLLTEFFIAGNIFPGAKALDQSLP